MCRSPRLAILISALILPALLAGSLAAAEPELISAKPFDVQVANGLVNVSFTLTLSEVSSYPVTITAIRGATEEVLYEGSLSEGVYRLSAPLTKISGSGELKVVLKTRVVNRTTTTVEKDGQKLSRGASDSYLVYLKWQGSL